MKQLPKPLPDQPTTEKPPQERANKRGRLPRISLKPLVYIAIALTTCALVVWAFRPTPILVDTGKIERGELRVTVDAEGKTRVRDRFVVSAPVDGRLARIELEAGDPVQQGTLVARIDPLPLTSEVRSALGRLAEWKAQREGVATQRPKTASLEQARTRIQAAQAAQRQAQARVVQAQAALEQARRDRIRAQQLESAGAISRKERETAELNETTKAKDLEAAALATKAAASEVEVARAALTVLQQQQSDPDYLLKVYDARIASVEAELAKLRDEARRTEMRSPVRGQVLRVLQKSAQFVASGTPLLELGDVSKLELVIDVLSTDAVKVQPGDPILIDRGMNEKPLQAQVQRIEPSAFTKVSALGVEEQRVNIIGHFIDSPLSLGDAYRVEAQIIIWEGKNILKAPLSSLFRCEKSAWCTFVIQEGKANRRVVEVGQRNNFAAEIRQGLQEGEAVILHPTEQINHESRVAPRSG